MFGVAFEPKMSPKSGVLYFFFKYEAKKVLQGTFQKIWLIQSADLQISNSNQSNQNLEGSIFGVLVGWLFVRLYAVFRTRTNTSQTM